MKRKRTAKPVSEIKEQPLCFRRKQLRPQLYRWRRLHISPVVFAGDDSHFPTVSEVSCDSIVASMSILIPPEKLQRIITRSYYGQNFKNASKNNEAVELSDVSCVQSRSGTMILKSSNAEEVDVEGGEVTKSEVSGTFSFPAIAGKVKRSQSSVGTTQSEVGLEIPGVNENSFEEITNSDVEKDYSDENGDVPLNSTDRASKVGGIEAASGEILFPDLFHLACSEQFSNGSVTNYGDEADDDEEELNSSSSAIFHMASKFQLESSDYTPSIWSYASGSQVSEESSSPTFELFGKFKQQFCRSTCSLTDCDDHNSAEINELGLEDEEDEESFRMMRRRERRQEYVHDYAEEDCNYTAYRDLVIQQRLQMVHWIVEEPTKTELQQKTMFLGVNQELDRFLSKGYFKNMRNLQIAGIACLSLATGIEENQPYNCISLNEHRFYLKAARANEKMGHKQLCYWLSTVAAGLVIIASTATNQDPSCPLVTELSTQIVSLAREPFRPSKWPSSKYKLTDAAANRTLEEHDQLEALQDIHRAKERMGVETTKAQLRAELIQIKYEGGFTFTVQWMKRPNSTGFDFFIHGVFQGRKKKTGWSFPLTLKNIDEEVNHEIQTTLHRIMPTKYKREGRDTIKIANQKFCMHPRVYFQIIIHLDEQIRPFLNRLAADLSEQRQTFMVGDLICRIRSYLGFYAHVSGTKQKKISATVMLHELKVSVDDDLYFVDYRGDYMGHLIEKATNDIRFLPDGM